MRQILKLTFLLQLLLIFPLIGEAEKAYALNIPDQYPMAMTFRASPKGNSPKNKAFQMLLENEKDYAWIHAPGMGDKSSITRQHLPDKIITLQGAYGGVSEPAFGKVWPGHLLYKPGALLTKDISEQNKFLYVDDFKRLIKHKKKSGKSNHKFLVAFIIYALDSNGKPDWSKSEHVLFDGFEKDKIRIKRGQWGTKPLAFKAGKSVAAAHMMFWSHQWQLNLSLDSPRGGPENNTAAEWFAKHIAANLADSGANGIELDVGRWTWGYPAENPMDINNDRVADYGYLDGVNSFGLGGQVLFKELRKLVGHDKLVQVDSNDAIYGVRGWRYLNGIQMEAFPSANGFERFSQGFTHLRLWAENAEEQPRVSYPFTKTATTVFANARLPNGAKTDFRFRAGLASACLLGMPHPFASLANTKFDPSNIASDDDDGQNEVFGIFKWDEYHGGDLNDWHWLGHPLGPAKQDLSNLNKVDLLANADWQWVAGNGFKAEHSEVGGVYAGNVKQIPEGELPPNLWEGLKLTAKGKLPNLQGNHEYTLEFEAKGEDTWHYAGQTFDRVPRMVTINGLLNAKNGRPLSVLADSTWRSYRISFTADASTVPALTFGVGEQIGKTELRNIKMVAGGAERWSREFEKGLVLLNMSQEPWKVAVKKNYYRRLKGSQAPEVNNGQLVDTEVVVPPSDALFLVKR